MGGKSKEAIMTLNFQFKKLYVENSRTNFKQTNHIPHKLYLEIVEIWLNERKEIIANNSLFQLHFQIQTHDLLDFRFDGKQ